MVAEDLHPGIGEILGTRFVEVEEGRAVLEATPGVHLYNPIGTVHGGFAATVLHFMVGPRRHTSYGPSSAARHAAPAQSFSACRRVARSDGGAPAA